MSTLFVLMVTPPINAGPYFKNEPDGFRGVRWGENLRKRDDMTPYTADKDLTVYFIRKGDESTIGDAWLESINYKTWEDIYYGMFLLFKGYGNYQSVLKVCFEKFGKVNMRGKLQETYIWHGENVDILLVYYRLKDDGFLDITHHKYNELKNKYDTEKAKQGAEKDF